MTLAEGHAVRRPGEKEGKESGARSLPPDDCRQR